MAVDNLAMNTIHVVKRDGGGDGQRRSSHEDDSWLLRT